MVLVGFLLILVADVLFIVALFSINTQIPAPSPMAQPALPRCERRAEGRAVPSLRQRRADCLGRSRPIGDLFLRDREDGGYPILVP